MTRQHTPGPWVHNGQGDITHSDEQPIAFVNFTAYAEGQSNARLIAAAPELLAALEKAAAALEARCAFGEADKANAIISKATGGEQ